MKKILSFVLCLLMIFIFSGCNENNLVLSTYERTEETRVTLLVVEDSITPEEVALEITNKTNAFLNHNSSMYFLEQKIDGEWYRIIQDGVDLLNNMYMYPKFTATQPIRFEKALKKGRYRIFKEFVSEGNRFFADAEFEIK